MEPENQPNPKPPAKYGKRPMWQWIVLYVVLAIIVYAIVYLTFFHSSSTGSGTTGTGGGFSY